METLIRSIGVLACIMLLIVIWAIIKQARTPKPEGAGSVPKNLRMPALAMGFVDDEKEVTDFLGARPVSDTGSMRAQLRTSLYGDYLFIAMYWLLFAGLCVLLITRGPKWAMWVGVAAAVCATGAAIFDVIENLRMAALLEATEINSALVRDVASANLGKWLFFAFATLLLSLLFLRRNWLVVLFGLYIVVGLLCLGGLLGKKPSLVEWAFSLTALALVPLALVFTFWPQKVLEC